MNSARVAVALFVLLSLIAGCGDDGEVLPFEKDTCGETGVTVCGLTGLANPAGADRTAVLICSPAKSWEVSKVCQGVCFVDATHGATCQEDLTGTDASLPPDAGDDIADQPLDVVDPADATEATTADAGPDAIPKDIIFPDLMKDLTPPWVESAFPAAGAMGVEIPFTVQITFTEPVFAPTIGEKTVKLTDSGGDKVNLTYELDETGSILVCTPTEAVFHSSPYRVTLDPMIKDLAGNMMGNNYEFTFYTGAVPTLGYYKELAAKFSPLIYQETNPDHPEYDYITNFNLDGDWVAEDNVEYIKSEANKVESWAHYSVTETKSHFFITYIFYYPFRYAENDSARFGNDVSGAVVVVRKSDETPIAVETYFKNDTDERSYAYLASGSGLVADGEYAKYKFKALYPAQDLFPNGHYVAYLSARNHESCIWLDEGNSGLDRCKLNSGIKAQMKKIVYEYVGGTPTSIEKSGGSFPKELDNVGYGLIHILDTWWARRNDVGTDKMWASAYEYDPHTSTVFKNRPTLSHDVPAAFVNPIEFNDNGRPPWAWKWAPGDFPSGFYNIKRGVLFLDPAVHFKQRHDQGNNWPGFDGENGWSLEYCFNPYFHLDFRGIWPECTSK